MRKHSFSHRHSHFILLLLLIPVALNDPRKALSKMSVDEDEKLHDNYESDEDNHETAGLLTSSNNGNRSIQDKRLRKVQTKGRLRPVELMHFQIPRKSVDRGSAISRSVLVFLLFSIGYYIWWWSGTQSEVSLSVERWHKLKVDDIRSWCLNPVSSLCKCSNPLEPQHRKSHKTWSLAHEENMKHAMHADSVDVVFLGDSITEGWTGKSLGQPVKHKASNIQVFNSLFHVDEGADFQGLPLGISGDKTFHLLWRIQNGELPDSLQPSLWWITIGTNDFLSKDHCSPEVVLMGIKRVVEEVRRLRPGSIIVVNSLLPRSTKELNGKLIDTEHPGTINVWEGILEVNRGLRLYCENYVNVVFFDATDIFLDQRDNRTGIEGMYIPENLMDDFLHPTPEGLQRWGEDMVEAIHDIIDASKSKTGRKPLPHWWDGVRTSASAQNDYLQ